MDHVARAGHQAPQPVRGGLGAARIRTGLHRVDVEMIGSGVRRIRREDTLEGDHDLLGARLGRTLRCPQAPRAEIHERVGQERGRVEVVRELPRDIAHGIRVGAVERRPAGAGGRGVPGRQRGDQCPLALGRGRRGQRARLIDRGERPKLALRVGRAVVVRAVRQRHAPRAHRARRIEAGGLAESGLGLVVVEAVDEPQTLVEEGLRPRRRGGDGAMVATQVVEERGRDGRRRGGAAVVVRGRLSRAAGQEGGGNQERGQALGHGRGSST